MIQIYYIYPHLGLIYYSSNDPQREYYFSDMNITGDDVFNWPSEYVRIMNLYDDYTDLDIIRNQIREKTNNEISWAQQELPELSQRFERLRLTDQDIEILVELHRRVLVGDVSMTTLLSY